MDGGPVDDDVPEGFHPLPDRPEIEAYAGPFYERLLEDGTRELGFRVTRLKLNTMGVCHGGILALFADIQGSPLKQALNLAVESPTINLSVDFAAPAPAGSWVSSRPELVRQTKGLLFFQSKLYADGVLCARVSGIYRLLRRSGGY